MSSSSYSASESPDLNRKTTNSSPVPDDALSAQTRTRTESDSSQIIVVEAPEDINNDQSEHNFLSQPSNETTPVTDGPEVTHCWICLAEESEDVGDRKWRSPCPCNLRGHEDCLLDWIADIELQSTRGTSNKEPILCPQCRSEIHVARPRDYFVDAIDAVSRSARQTVLPLGLSTAVGVLYAGSMAQGLNSLTWFFGLEETSSFLVRSARRVEVPGALGLWLGTHLVLPGWQVLVGVPLISPVLILSRTNLLDYAFNVAGCAYLALNYKRQHLREWPPSPGLAFTVLALVRTLYRQSYHQLFCEAEKGWDRAVERQPREGETAEQVAAGRRARDDGNGFNIEVDIVLEGGPMDGQEEFGDHAAGAAPHQARANIQDANPRPGMPGPQEIPRQPDQPVVAQPANEGQFAMVDNALGREGISVNKVAQNVLGALFMPMISGIMGDIIRVMLPKNLVQRSIISSKWSLLDIGDKLFKVQRNELRPATGLLQLEWGRSLVGGCLFIVLKDALSLYSKWRKAKMQSQRRVLDHVNRAQSTR